jgi:hypothetical protein
VSDARSTPTFQQFVVDIGKLRDYCLSPTHPHGRNKARVFRVRLGLRQSDAELLRDALRNAPRDFPDRLVHRKTDQHGDQYRLSFEMNTPAGMATIRSIWIARSDQPDVLRFISCYLE